jgi:Ca2+-transporting ATPase
MTIEKFSPKIGISTSPDGQHWHTLGAEQVLETLNTLAERGLSDEEAARRMQEFGPNQLTEAPPPTFLQMLWEQFNNFVVLMLIVAAVISAFLGDFIEAAAIMAIVLLNAILGIVQERRAEQALAALRKLAAPEAHVIRSGMARQVSEQCARNQMGRCSAIDG